MAQALSNLPVGAKVKFGKYSVNGEAAEPIVWLVAARNHVSIPAYPANSVTLLTERIIDLRAFDAIEPNHSISNIKQHGNPQYSLSNLDQWLNKDGQAGKWYSSQHVYDIAPTGTYVTNSTGYDARPGFLNAFTSNEKNAILTTTVRVAVGSASGNGYEDISRKVFLPSIVETHGDTFGSNEGAQWELFGSYNLASRAALTSQAWGNTSSGHKPSSISEWWWWWLRTSTTPNTPSSVRTIVSGGVGGSDPYEGAGGVRPAMNLSSTLSVSDATDVDGCYTIVWNSAPPAPSSINVPTVYGGKPHSISWSGVTDPDGDAVTYELECSVNGGTFTRLYSGRGLIYTHLVSFGTTSVAYRVKAFDTFGASSNYVTSGTKTVVNNNAPVISGADSVLDVKSSGFTGTYTITDANNDAVTVTEAIDGVPIRSLVATLGQAITYGVTGNTWLALPNGSHTLTITATDGIDTSVRTYTFTKLVDSFKIQNATPWVSEAMPTRIMVLVTRVIPSTATFKVEVCNNGYDASPTWEDATEAVKSGLVHVFANTEKTEISWGVLVRVTVNRNGATGACYVSAIGGNFE